MKKIIASMMTAVLVGTLVSGDLSVYASNTVATEHDLIELSNELITDGGFEAQNSRWGKTGDGSLTTFEGAADTGQVCGLLPSNSGNASVYQLVNLKPNTEYVAKARILVALEGQTINFVVKSKTVENIPNFNAEAVVVGGQNGITPWQYHDVEFTFNSQNNIEIALAVMKWTEDNSSATYKGQVYVDNVSLKEKNATSSSDYDILWADDFKDQKLNLNKWDYELGHIRGLEQQHYVRDDKNVYVDNGNLVIEATDRDVDSQYDITAGGLTRKVIYDSGSIRTHDNQEFLYGRLEVKAKLPKGKGVFPAFWTLGSDFCLDGTISGMQGYGWARCGEIDIMELTGTESGYGNKTVYQTVHTSVDDNDHKLAGTSYTINQDFNDDFHVFGINWSKNKIEWYVDDKIVQSVDYSNDDIAKKCLNKPQYIQLNLAMGGAWPGEVGTNLAGSKYEVDYVYYGQSAEQKAQAAEYYANAPKVTGAKDVIMTQGDVPDLLNDVIATEGYYVDYSIDDDPLFDNNAGNSRVSLIVDGVGNKSKLANLKPGEYTLYYTAIPKDAKPDSTYGWILERTENYLFDRDVVKLTVNERTFPTVTLNGVYGEKLSTVTLPDNWTWDDSTIVMTDSETEYNVNYENNGFETTAKVKVQLDAADKTVLKNKIDLAKTYSDESKYTNETLTKLQEKIAAAETVLNKTTATKTEVTEAIKGLETAIAGLVEKPITPPVEDVYEIVEDKQQVAKKGEAMTFRSSASVDKFKEVLIDGKTLDKAHYTVKEGSTIIILSAEYTQLLSSGKHTITIVSTDGEASTSFTIKDVTSEEKPEINPEEKPTDKPSGSETSKPTTSDNTNIALFVGLSSLALIGMWMQLRKKED